MTREEKWFKAVCKHCCAVLEDTCDQCLKKKMSTHMSLHEYQEKHDGKPKPKVHIH